MLNLKDRREELGMTQLDVAVGVGVSVNAYQMWERGASKPNEENLRKLKEVLQIKE